MTDWPKIPEMKYEVVDFGEGQRKIIVQKISLGTMGDWEVPEITVSADTTEEEFKVTVEELQNAFDRVFLKIAAAILTRSGESPYEGLQTMIEMCEWAWSNQHPKEVT